MKKTLLLLTAILTFAVTSAQEINDIFTYNNLNYKITSLAPNPEVELIKQEPTLAIITVPRTVTDSNNENYTVTSVQLQAFYTAGGGWTVPTSAVVEEGHTTLAQSMFNSLTNLTTVSLPSTLTGVLTKRAFRGCSSLTTINIPEGITTIGDEAFQDCTSLASITLPSTVTAINLSAFRGNTSLTAMELLSTTPPTLDAAAFTNTDIASIALTVPAGTEVAYANAGWGVFNILNLPSGDVTGDTFTVDNIEYRITSTLLLEAEVSGSTLANVAIPETVMSSGGATYSVTAIGVDAFKQNTNLVSVVLPSSVTHLKANAFSECINLETINLENVVITESYNVFYDCYKLTTANFAAVTNIGQFMFFTSTSPSTLADVSIPSAVIIGKGSFRATAIAAINIPATVTEIGQMVFRDCSSLKDIYVNWTIAEAIVAVTANDVVNSANGDPFGTFYGVSGATLHVPFGTTALYEVADVWKDFTIVEQALSINDVNEVAFSMHPNPTSGLVSFTSLENIVDITIFNINGSVLLNSKSNQLDVSSLASGVYFAKVKTVNGFSVKKLIKK